MNAGISSTVNFDQYMGDDAPLQSDFSDAPMSAYMLGDGDMGSVVSLGALRAAAQLRSGLTSMNDTTMMSGLGTRSPAYAGGMGSGGSGGGGFAGHSRHPSGTSGGSVSPVPVEKSFEMSLASHKQFFNPLESIEEKPSSQEKTSSQTSELMSGEQSQKQMYRSSSGSRGMGSNTNVLADVQEEPFGNSGSNETSGGGLKHKSNSHTDRSSAHATNNASTPNNAATPDLHSGHGGATNNTLGSGTSGGLAPSDRTQSHEHD